MFSGKEGALHLVWLSFLMHVGVKGINIILFYYLVNIVFFYYYRTNTSYDKKKKSKNVCNMWKETKLISAFWSFATILFISHNAASQA